MIAIRQRVEWSEPRASRATWRTGACLAVALIGFLFVVPSTHSLAQRSSAESPAQCDGQGRDCVALPQSIQFTLLADTVNSPPSFATLPAGIGKLKGVTGHAGTMPGLHSANTTGQPCHSTTLWVANITNWTAPPGCYGQIYYPDPSKYYSPTSFGYCNWWVEALHPGRPDILSGTKVKTPVPGAAVWFDPNVQGASAAGHWAEVVAIHPGGYWLLITEMNFAWRGGGFGRVDYRYVHVGPGVFFIH